MPAVTIVQIVYNNRRFMKPVFSAIFSQTYGDCRVVAVIAGNEDGGREFLAREFPQVDIIDPGYNIGFAAGHNLVFSRYDSGFFQLVNPDLVLRPDYVETMLAAFSDPTVGAATGKLYQVDRDSMSTDSGGPYSSGSTVLDTTGVVIYPSGRARDRGQHETDRGQYDLLPDVQAVSGAGPMLRRAALESVRYDCSGRTEYFDEDFHSYWEDVDLTWRMARAGWRNRFVPQAVGYHGRGAAASKNGYSDVIGFIRHHSKLPPVIRRLNYKNHIFLYIKNSPRLSIRFLFRELCMLCYVLLFEISTLAVLPELFRQLPLIWKKRKIILAMVTHRTLASSENR